MAAAHKPESTTEKDTRLPLIREILSGKDELLKEWTSEDMKNVVRKLLAQYTWELYRSELEFE
jgi:hypothetical protein